MISLCLVDDHTPFRQNLKKYLNNVPNFKVVSEAANGLELLKELTQSPPDIILLDLWMPEMDGIQAAGRIMSTQPEMKIIVLTSLSDPSHIIAMYKLGVKSFVWKDKEEDIVRAIKVVYEGGFYFPDDIGHLIQKYLQNENEEACPFVATDKELELLRYICNGLSSREIGLLLDRSHRTVEEYREKLYEKFEVTSKEELIAKAVRWKLC